MTLTGEAPSLEVKSQIMQAFNGMVATENTINQISIPKATGTTLPPLGQVHASEVRTSTGARVHEVVKGDTLSGIAQKYYGNAGSYRKIFDANRKHPQRSRRDQSRPETDDPVGCFLPDSGWWRSLH